MSKESMREEGFLEHDLYKMVLDAKLSSANTNTTIEWPILFALHVKWFKLQK